MTLFTGKFLMLATALFYKVLKTRHRFTIWVRVFGYM